MWNVQNLLMLPFNSFFNRKEHREKKRRTQRKKYYLKRK